MFSYVHLICAVRKRVNKSFVESPQALKGDYFKMGQTSIRQRSYQGP